MRNFRDLTVWSKGLAMAKLVYRVTNQLPEVEKYGLKLQMQRAAVSIPSNIAEGASRNSRKEFKRFLEIAMGSAFELETQLLLAKELNYISNEDFQSIEAELHYLQKQINAFISTIKY